MLLSKSLTISVHRSTHLCQPIPQCFAPLILSVLHCIHPSIPPSITAPIYLFMNLPIHPAHPSLHQLTPDIPPYIPPFYKTAQPSHFHPFLHKNIHILLLIELSTYFCTHLSEHPSNHLTIPPPRNCRPSTSSYIISLISSPHPSIHHSNHPSIEPYSHHFIHHKTCISEINQPIPPFNSIFTPNYWSIPHSPLHTFLSPTEHIPSSVSLPIPSSSRAANVL